MGEGPYRVPELPAEPRRVVPALGVFGVLLFAGLFWFTGDKLWTALQLRGWVSGIEIRHVVVSREVQQRIQSERGSVENHALLDVARPSERGLWIQLREANMRMYLAPERQPFPVRCIESTKECFVPESVYISNGNIQFDGVLLGLWVVLWSLSVRSLVRSERQYRLAHREWRALATRKDVG